MLESTEELCLRCEPVLVGWREHVLQHLDIQRVNTLEHIYTFSSEHTSNVGFTH